MSKAERRRSNQSPNLRLSGIVTNPRFWATSLGHEFWCTPGDSDITGTKSAINNGLSGYGWTQSVSASGVITVTNGASGDFLSSSGVTPNYLSGAGNATGSATLISPVIFGAYGHMLQASMFLGYMPTTLNASWYGQVSATTTSTSYIGFAHPGSSNPDTTTCAVIMVKVTGTSNFNLRMAGISDDGGALADTNWHKFGLKIDATTTEWFIDDVSQGTMSTQLDMWPCSFNLLNSDVASSTTWSMHSVRIWYS